MAKKYLDYDGLLYFWQKIKSLFVSDITYNSSSKKIQKTKNGSTSDVVTLSAVATSGSYGDLSNKPSIPTLTNVFGIVKVGSTSIEADNTRDTLELAAGSNVSITPDATNDKVTISATDTTYSDATTSAHGLMSANDKAKLNGIAAGAEVNVQADWNATDTSSDAYIKNKPTIPTVEDEIFIAEYGETSYADVASAYGAGKQIFMKKDEDGDYIFAPLTMSLTNEFVFVCIWGESLSLYAYQLNLTAEWSESFVYLAGKESPAFTGTPTAPTAASGTNNTQIATTAFVTTAVQSAVTGATAYQGIAPTSFAPTNYTAGWYWIIGTAGTYVGQTCEAGDMIFCKTGASTYSASNFDVVQTNLDITSITNAEVDTIVAS